MVWLMIGTMASGIIASGNTASRALAMPPAAVKKPSEAKLAELALLQGRLDEAVSRSQALIAADPKDFPSRLVLCRAFYAEELVDEAVTACEAAVQNAPADPVLRSQTEDWLGRAYGLKADHSGPIAGFQLARRVKTTFEAAVEHNPRNGDAVNDLSEYYVNAPSVVGGGLDRADALADSSMAQLPQQAHRIRALAAEKRHDFPSAEREFRAAVDVAQRPDAWVDLGNFYKRRNRYDQAVEALHHALEADRLRDASIVDAASILHEMQRELPLAERTLHLYLDSPARSDAAPAVQVHVLLSKMRSEAGDKAGAKIEVDAALALAQRYPPAKRAQRELQPS
jgi:tetratricopeptide (TPR) repeat protein